MVVKFLETYFQNRIPGATSPVSLLEVIRNAADEGKNTPTVVVDSSSLVVNFSDGLNTICNGQLIELKQRLLNFCRIVEEAGGRLVIFFQGSDEYQSRDLWVKKRMDKLQSVHNVFDDVRAGKNISTSPLQLTSAHACAFYTLQSAPQCEVHFSVRECDEDVMKYIRSHDCVALLGQDSDYLIYDKIPLYLSFKSMNWETLEFLQYDRAALLKHFQLTSEQLPLFASLLGNEIVAYDSVLIKFHIYLINGRMPRGNPYVRAQDRGRVMEAVARLVKTKNTPPKLYQELSEISRLICGTDDMTVNLMQSVKMYFESKEHVDTPTEDENMSRIVQLASELKEKAKLWPLVHRILTKNHFSTNNDLEDFRVDEFQPIARVLRPLRKKLYGMIVQESGNMEVTEWCVEGVLSSATKEFTMKPFVVNVGKTVPHPGLLKLWDDNSNLSDLKWSLLCEAVSEDLNPEELKLLPSCLVMPTLALYYLSNELLWPFFKQPFEIRSFVVVALRVADISVEELQMIKVPCPDARALQLSSLFLRCLHILDLMNNALGNVIPFDALCFSNFFDGKLYQQIYRRMKEGSNEEANLKNEQMAIFERIMGIVQKRVKTL